MPDPGQVAEDRIRDRWREIKDELALIRVAFLPDEIFEPPKAQPNQTIRIARPQTSRICIAVVEGLADFVDGKVLLDIREKYSYSELFSDLTKPLTLLDYSYQLSFMPEFLIESRMMPSPARSHWGDLLLTQRRFYRFDGQDAQQWAAQPLPYRNQHAMHHFHPGAGEYLRLPVSAKPSVLAVACFALVSFDYERWEDCCKVTSSVLSATRELLPHVTV